MPDEINAYWLVPKSDLDAKINAFNHDELGLHKCCRMYQQGQFYREAPVSSLDLGPITEVLIKCDAGMDILSIYPNAIEKTLTEARVYVDDETNLFFNPSVIG